MELSSAWRDGVLVASLSGEINAFDVTGTKVFEQVAKAEASGIVLDLAHVSYVASMGLGMLTKLAKDLAARGITIRLAAVRPAIQSLLCAVRLDTLLPMDASVDQAVQALAPA